MDRDRSKVAAVVVNWNRCELLLEAVGSLAASNWPNLRVIVVDNGSTDGSAEAIAERYPDAVVLRNCSNLGFAVGSGQGLDEALKDGGDYIFFLNNDATVEPDAVLELVGLFESHPRAGAAAPYILYHNRRDRIWYGGGIVALWRGWIGHRHLRHRFRQDKHQPALTGYITGCAFMARAGALKEVGGFDTGYGLYSEDVDLSLRLQRAGWELWVTPKAVTYHRVSVTAGGELSPFKAFHRGRSNALLVRRYTPVWAWPTLIIGGVIGGIALTVRLLPAGRIGTACALWQGIISGLAGGRIPDRYSL